MAISSGKGPACVMIHGNSSCEKLFRKQFEALGGVFHLIGVDLPGHGASDDATDPERTYTIPGYAETVSEAVAELGVKEFSILGASLGGHIGIEMLKMPQVKKLLIIGTPPIPLTEEGFSEGFILTDAIKLIGQEKLSEEEAITLFERSGLCRKKAPELLDAVHRTDGRARKRLIDSMKHGVGGDQLEIVHKTKKPFAIIGGKSDPGINHDYIKRLKLQNLWGNRGTYDHWHALRLFRQSDRLQSPLRRFS